MPALRSKVISVLFIALCIPVLGHAQGGSWTTKAPMPTPVPGWGGMISGQLHVVGEAFSGGVQMMVHRVYDPATDTWTSKAPPLLARSSVGEAAVIDGKLYVAGGCLAFPPTGGDCRIGLTNQLEVYAESLGCISSSLLHF